MEFRHLRYFVVVAEELHFGRAAERLQMTQPALSKQIAALEQEIDVLLLMRTKRTVQLTSAGQCFLERARQLLSQADEAIQVAKRTARGEIGQLTLGFTVTATYTVLPKLVRRFRDRYPNVEITMLELSTEVQVAALNQHTIDLAFLHPPIDERGLALHLILEETFVVVLPKHHPLLEQKRLSLALLAHEKFILHPRQEGPMLYDSFRRLCYQVGFQPQIVKEVGSHQTRICLVAAGMGITFVPASVKLLVQGEVACREIEDIPIKLQLAAAWRQNEQMPTLREFLKDLQGEQ
ncbi:MAG: LysR family transcriptional regulator [Cyanophyceae cyanobacterium]